MDGQRGAAFGDGGGVGVRYTVKAIVLVHVEIVGDLIDRAWGVDFNFSVGFGWAAKGFHLRNFGVAGIKFLGVLQAEHSQALLFSMMPMSRL